MGPVVQTRRQAWKLVTRQLEDPDILWLDEPAGLEDAWRALSARDHHDQVWTADYLAAFARLTAARLVTLDRALAKRHPTIDVVTL